jgi:hypothetical protein
MPSVAAHNRTTSCPVHDEEGILPVAYLGASCASGSARRCRPWQRTTIQHRVDMVLREDAIRGSAQPYIIVSCPRRRGHPARRVPRRIVRLWRRRVGSRGIHAAADFATSCRIRVSPCGFDVRNLEMPLRGIWRRRESNPRLTAQSFAFYMLSRCLFFLLKGARRQAHFSHSDLTLTISAPRTGHLDCCRLRTYRPQTQGMLRSARRQIAIDSD